MAGFLRVRRCDKINNEAKKSGLGLKFSLAVGVILLLFCGFFSTILYHYLKSQVIKEAEEKTVIIMTQVRSIGGYVRETLRPAIFETLKNLNAEGQFIVEAMSTTHVSLKVMDRFNRELTDYTYKRVSDNPRNLKNRADTFHLKMIDHFRQFSNLTTWNGVETLDDGKRYLIRLRPIFMEQSCLQCHGKPSDAPAELIKMYGSDSGFHWQVGTVIGLDSVSIPLDVALAQVRKVAIDAFLFGSITLGVLFLALFGTFRQLVSRPLNNLSDIFRGIANGTEPLGRDIPSGRSDEIGDVTESFNVLSRHLLDAQEKLKQSAELEKQMMQTEKLASLGQLSAGVAHEINNPLGGIRLCFDNLMKTPMDEETRREHIEVITSGFNRIQGIVRQLLDFSKNTPLSIARGSLNEIADNVLQFSEFTIAQKGIRLAKDFQPDLPDVMVDSNKLEQVFLNLIINAVQSMEGEGVLTVRTWNAADWCYIAFEDTGRGIQPEVARRIFDPFFTTKEVGEGTGLGLTVSRSIIEQHKGKIDVETSGQGTTFTIRLPCGGTA